MRYLILAVLVLSGCATTYYPLRGQSTEKFHEDVAECEAKAGQAAGPQWSVYRDRVRDSCMRGRGWTTEKP